MAPIRPPLATPYCIASALPGGYIRVRSGPQGPALGFCPISTLVLTSDHETSQHCHHRPCRPRQDHAGGPAAAAIRLLPGQPAGGRARHGFQRSGARARHHDPVESHLAALARQPHQYRGHPRARRFRRRGRAHPQHGGGRHRAGGCRRRPAAADQVRGLQGAQGRVAPDRGHQQGRPPGCAAFGGRQRGVRPVRGARCDRGAARFPGALRLRQGRLDGRDRRGPESLHGAAVRPGAAPCGAPQRRDRPAAPVVHHPGGQSVSRPHRHRPHHLGLHQAQPERQGAGPRGQADRGGPRHQGAGVPRPRAAAGRGGLRGRHRGGRGPARGHRLPHHLRPRGHQSAAGAADGSARRSP